MIRENDRPYATTLTVKVTVSVTVMLSVIGSTIRMCHSSSTAESGGGSLAGWIKIASERDRERDILFPHRESSGLRQASHQWSRSRHGHGQRIWIIKIDDGPASNLVQGHNGATHTAILIIIDGRFQTFQRFWIGSDWLLCDSIEGGWYM